MSEPEAPGRETRAELLQTAHDALDLLESSLRALAAFERSVPIDLVLRVRRRIIEIFTDATADQP